MCGIIGCVGITPCAGILLNGLEKLEYRGYDSAGIAVLEHGKIYTFKEKGRLDNLCSAIENGANLVGTIGIGHTRWATHGKPSKENAHPHMSNHGVFAVVHNGIIENYATLRSELIAKGYSFYSQTDTEIIAVLIEDLYEGDVLQAIRAAVEMLDGSYALGILCTDTPDVLYCVRKHSPLIIGVGEQQQFIASDVTPLLNYTRTVCQLADGEMAVLSKHHVQVYDDHLNPVEKETTFIQWNVETAEKGGYDHFMLKEIFEQPKAVRDTLEPRIRDGVFHLDELNFTMEELKKINKIFIIACGSAYHVGVVGKYVLEHFTRLPVESDVASEFRYRNPIMDQKTLCIIISQSGETADTLAALREARKRGARTLSIVNVVGSTIANESENVLYTAAGPEISVATTKAYSTQMALLYGIGLYLAHARESIAPAFYAAAIEGLLGLPAQIEEVLGWNDTLSALAQRYAYLDHAYFLGRNLDYGVALEASLKLKEISYIHSEAYPAGELKHGTISLIEEGTFVVGILCCEALLEKTLSNIKEVRARGAEVLCLTTEQHMAAARKESDHVITVPDCFPYFLPSLEVVPMQLLGYHIARARNCDIDKPRNLAKSVTVE